MSESIAGRHEDFVGNRTESAVASSTPSYQAYQILHVGFVAAPVIAGIDKFLHLLVNWDIYLAPAIARLSPHGRTWTDAGRWRYRDRRGAFGSVQTTHRGLRGCILALGHYCQFVAHSQLLRRRASRLRLVTGRSRTGAAEHGVQLLTLRREDISLPIAWRSEAERAAAAAGNTSLSSVAM